MKKVWLLVPAVKLVKLILNSVVCLVIIGLQLSQSSL
jgi:hypothetical protein